MRPQLLFLELNEINLEDVAYYCDRGSLPHFNRLIGGHGWATTTSEERYDDIEPWIQWVTAHTGMSLAEHGIFRLGDIVRHDLPQIWECLEAAGLRVGAVSPMNAKHCLRDAAFFVPDPWTSTEVTAPPILARLHRAITQLVNDNARSRVTGRSMAALIAGLAAYALPQHYPLYGALIASSGLRPWRRAILLDLLLADVFITQVRRTQSDFATLFLNAGAHIQHHYLFSAESYRGRGRNPDWYIRPGLDPVREVYAVYDRILGAVQRRFPAARVMIATGLHQDPHSETTYYWRLREHGRFLSKIGVDHARVEPRMSRDFVVTCTCAEQAQRAAARLAGAVARDGTPLFEVDDRGSDLFVTLVYSGNISAGFTFAIGREAFSGFEKDVAFVALKNGQHNGTGYFLDTAADFRGRSESFELKRMPRLVADALGVPCRGPEVGAGYPRSESNRGAAASSFKWGRGRDDL